MTVHLRSGNQRRRPPAAAGGPGLALGLWLLVLVTATALFYAYTSTRALEVSYQASRELQLKRQLMETGRRLRVELNSLRSPARLERAALKRGLAVPGPGQVRRLP